MLCYTSNQNAIPIYLLTPTQFPIWLNQQTDITKTWLSQTYFKAEAGNMRVIPRANGEISQVVYCMAEKKNFWEIGSLPFGLPEGDYQLFSESSDNNLHTIAWGLGAYQFSLYKKAIREPARLYLPSEISAEITNIVESLYLVRDCINTPTDNMGPSELAEVTQKLAHAFGANIQQIVGEDLLQQNYSGIYTVGRASDDAPRLLDLRWGNPKHPKVTLVGKGVCFDTGGLDIKPSPYMLLMKKDMAGGAHVLGLARMIMQAQLPICLRVLIPAVENAISGNAYRPGDIIQSRKGITIEVGNTDAEGRIVLADALTEAVSEKPDLLIDISTLTGAARIALGTDLPAVFSNTQSLAQSVIKHGENEQDVMWQLPLFHAYRELINSPIADINNNATENYGGAITAALFLNEFVPEEIPWLHFDMMAYNLRNRPGRPQGGEAMVLRALFAYLKQDFLKK